MTRSFVHRRFAVLGLHAFLFSILAIASCGCGGSQSVPNDQAPLGANDTGRASREHREQISSTTSSRDAGVPPHSSECRATSWPVRACSQPIAADLVGLWESYDESGRVIAGSEFAFDGCFLTSRFVPCLLGCRGPMRAMLEQLPSNPSGMYRMEATWDGSTLGRRSMYVDEGIARLDPSVGLRPADPHGGSVYVRVEGSDLRPRHFAVLCTAVTLPTAQR